MKKIVTYVVASVIFCQVANAKVWRINNNAGVTADFTAITTAAMDSRVISGDTLHVEPSTTQYSGASINKKLTIIGSGYFLTETSPMVANPKTQANTAVSNVNSITFSLGSKGSVAMGLTCNYFYMDDSLITIQRNNIGGYVYFNNTYNTSSDTIRQNYINGIGSNNYYSTILKAENIIIYNNIFTGSYPINFSTYTMNNNSGYFINNSCVYTYYSYFNCVNFIFQNDIFYTPQFGTYLSSNAFFNCLDNTATLPNTNSNKLNVDMSTVYQGFNSTTGLSSDGRYQLKASSPATNAGSLNGSTIDCGAFGGVAPYVLSGMPPIPSIYMFTAPSQVTSGTTSINVTVSSASH